MDKRTRAYLKAKNLLMILRLNEKAFSTWMKQPLSKEDQAKLDGFNSPNTGTATHLTPFSAN